MTLLTHLGLSIKLLEISGLVVVSHAIEKLVRHDSKRNNKRKEVKRKRVTLKQESKSKGKTQVNGKKKEK